MSMKRLPLLAALLAASAPLLAQRGPVVTARDDAPVAPTAEDAAAARESVGGADEDDGRAEGRFYLGVGGGAMRLHNTTHPKPGSNLRGVQPYVVLRLGYDFADSPWSLEGFGMLGRATKTSGSGSRTILGLGAEALWHFDRYARFDPFLAGGLAYYGATSAPVWQDGKEDHLFAQAGVGAFWHLTENLSLRGDLRWHVALADDFIHFTSADVGLTWFFGGAGDGSADALEPLAPVAEIEPGAKRYDETSAHAAKLRDVTPVGSGDQMRLELRVGFAKDTAIVSPSEMPVLDELTRIVLGALEANPQARVEIHGHADRQHGSDHAYNQELSEARARSVMNHLAQNGVPPARMAVYGHSFDQPRDPVDLDKGTPTNRRVEVLIRGVDAATRERLRAAQAR